VKSRVFPSGLNVGEPVLAPAETIPSSNICGAASSGAAGAAIAAPTLEATPKSSPTAALKKFRLNPFSPSFQEGYYGNDRGSIKSFSDVQSAHRRCGLSHLRERGGHSGRCSDRHALHEGGHSEFVEAR